MSTLLACPHCSGQVDSGGLPPGATVGCPHCRKYFSMPAAAVPAALPVAASSPPPLVARWYLSNDGVQRHGPYTDGQIVDQIVRGVVTRQALVWREGMAAWQVVGSVPEFQSGEPRPGPAAPPGRASSPRGSPAPGRASSPRGSPAPGRSSSGRGASPRGSSMRDRRPSSGARSRSQRTTTLVAVIVAGVVLSASVVAFLFVFRSESAEMGSGNRGAGKVEEPAAISPATELAGRFEAGSKAASKSFTMFKGSLGPGQQTESLLRQCLRYVDEGDVLCLAPDAERKGLDADLAALPKASAGEKDSIDVRLVARVVLDSEAAFRDHYAKNGSPEDAGREFRRLARESLRSAGFDHARFEAAVTGRGRTSAALRAHLAYFFFRLAVVHRSMAVLHDASVSAEDVARALGVERPLRNEIAFELATEPLGAGPIAAVDDDPGGDGDLPDGPPDGEDPDRDPSGGDSDPDSGTDDPGSGTGDPGSGTGGADPAPGPGSEPVWTDVQDGATFGRPGANLSPLSLDPGKGPIATAPLQEAWRYDGLSVRITAPGGGFAGVFFDGDRIAYVSGIDEEFVVAHADGEGALTRWAEDTRVPLPVRGAHEIGLVIENGETTVSLDGTPVVRVPARYQRLATTGLRVQGGEGKFESLRLRKRE
ncbi:MAG: DUF4339 domain-containing protein [Planctomycetes bacterium]|nr:DUF4339 domain-containing protein [Planctomycetota bacterium]